MNTLATTHSQLTDTRDFSLYLHWPFCLSKCPYCDFNSHVRDNVDHVRWRNALLRDLEHTHSLVPDRTVTSMFFGGGTPSLMEPATVAALIDRASTLWAIDHDVEITLEANPTSVEAKQLEEFRAAGINRVSLGVQALDDRALLYLGRHHSAKDAIVAVELASQLFDLFSFDLIYARPEQTIFAWRKELTHALTLADSHISVYQLTIEAGTSYYRRQQCGELVTPDELTAATMYEETQAILEDAGLPAYEVSNHALPGRESRHNLNYWRYGDYAGIGPGAHGRITSPKVKRAFRQIRGPEAWLSAVETNGHGAMNPQLLNSDERLEEMLMMCLRLTEPLSIRRIEEETGDTFQRIVNPDRLRRLVDGGFLKLKNNELSSTAAGRQRLNAVLGQLLI